MTKQSVGQFAERFTILPRKLAHRKIQNILQNTILGKLTPDSRRGLVPQAYLARKRKRSEIFLCLCAYVDTVF